MRNMRNWREIKNEIENHIFLDKKQKTWQIVCPSFCEWKWKLPVAIVRNVGYPKMVSVIIMWWVLAFIHSGRRMFESLLFRTSQFPLSWNKIRKFDAMKNERNSILNCIKRLLYFKLLLLYKYTYTHTHPNRSLNPSLHTFSIPDEVISSTQTTDPFKCNERTNEQTKERKEKNEKNIKTDSFNILKFSCHRLHIASGEGKNGKMFVFPSVVL